jgi:hypothetical protein
MATKKKKAGPAPEPTTQLLTVSRWLTVPLTPSEERKARTRLADGVMKKAALDEKVRLLKGEIAAEMSQAVAAIKQATRALAHGADKSVECEEIKDFKAKTYKLVRLDNGETVEERPLEDWEMQPDLEGEQVGEDTNEKED